jgi:antagonist of KipI
MSEITVIKPGMLTTVQDEGRWGYQSRGVPVAGPMDPWSHRLANALVGNDRSAATLEITLLGPELEVADERVAAVAGAEFEITVDDRPAPCNAAFLMPAGARIKFRRRSRGARAYFAVAGGVAVPVVLGSRATHVLAAMGGLNGRPLRAGDRLPLGEVARTRGTAPAPSEPLLPPLDRPAIVRVLPGPQDECFVDGALDLLQSAPYTIAQNSDRMGFRLEGPLLAHAHGPDLISDATPLGTLQVPASGQPILLMADRQTTGGYPKIATVITADMAVAGQLGPGDAIQFVMCTPHEAMAALIAIERAVMRVERWEPTSPRR